MKTTLTIVTAGCIVGLVACSHRSEPSPGVAPGITTMADLIRFNHARSYKTNGHPNRPDTLIDTWKFTDANGKPTPLRGHPVPAGGSLEWHSTNCFWLHAIQSPLLDWLGCANGTQWLQYTNLPCPFNGPNDVGMAATHSGTDWVVSLSFPTNVLHQTLMEIPYDLVMSDLNSQSAAATADSMVRIAAATYPCNLVVEATLVWESGSLGKGGHRGDSGQ